MADGTTLDVLSLELKASATSAQATITGLITSLGSLSSRLGSALGALKAVNNELRQMQGLGVVGTQATGATGAAQNTGAMSAYASTVGTVGNAVNIASENVGKLTVNIKEAGEASSSATRKTSGLASTVSRVGRIFSTMIIRLGLKKVISAFSDSWTAAYNFSKSIGGEFASSVDKASTLLSKATTSIVTAFSPALNALIPVITSVVSMIEYLCSAISWLFSLLGSTSDFFGVSTDSINKYSDAASGGSKSNKELLASFDELNVISSTSGGGSGGGSSYVSGLTDSITGELDALTFYIGESLLAVGLILACTGHVGIGVALMALGAAGIAKTIIEDWDKLSTEVKNQIAMITTIVGVSMLGLGAVLAFSGANIPLGIGMMAIGAINLAAAAYVSWKGGVSQEVMDQIALITAYVGTAFLALGAILALSGAAVGIGIGLMIAGAASLATSVAISWGGGISENVKKQILDIVNVVSVGLLALGAILLFTGANIPLGLGMLAVGGIGLVASSSPDWDSFVSKLKSIFNTVRDYLVLVWDTISTAVTNAWNAVKQWWENSGIGPAVRSAWAATKAYLTQMWESVSSFVTTAWDNVKKWWEDSGIGPGVRSAWAATKSYLISLWESVSSFITTAWNNVEKWWKESGVGTWVSETWSSVSDFFSNLWTNVKDWAIKAYDRVKVWWQTNVEDNIKKNGIWGGVKGYFQGLWETVRDKGLEAWDKLKKWWEDSEIGAKISSIWSFVKTYLVEQVWKPIERAIDVAWTIVTDWWENSGIGPGVRAVWSFVSDYLVNDIWKPIETAITSAWNTVAQWWNSTLIGQAINMAWENVVTFLKEDVWDPIWTVVSAAWEAVCWWWDNGILDSIKRAWDGVSEFLSWVFEPIDKALGWLSDMLTYDGTVIDMLINVEKVTTEKTIKAASSAVQTYADNRSKKSSSGESWTFWDDVTTLFDMGSSFVGSLLGFAEGGFPTSGDLFLANEEGAEYIGSMGGRTTVANQEEIISGIQRGVAEANSEQNSLLRQQNDLLRNILEKDSSVKLTASAALGRVTKQSMDLYSNVVGG